MLGIDDRFDHGRPVGGERHLDRILQCFRAAHAARRHAEIMRRRLAIILGLEFRAVAVMACDDEIIPLQQRIETVGDDADLQEVYDTERHLLYVACTRARDYLLVTSVQPESEFLDDFRS